ncbi:DUF3761 domain-containing protein [Amycolatopsis sp. NPDC023774]|uniref:DUF3761 domain-containing protein n=1 Tax=Amycolatopsis sp. NPDC023774 TaxID=3155015 RepID=UPI0033C4E1EA
MLRKLGLVLAAGLLVAGCGAAPAPAGSGGVVPPVTTALLPTTATSPATTSATPTTESSASTISTPTYVASETTTSKVTAPKTTAAAPKTTPAACGADYYRNSSGACVHRPSSSSAGATAKCKDGSYSYSQHRSGTCSGHGGVLTWINRPAS